MQVQYEKEKQILQKTLALIIKKHRTNCRKSISLICNEIDMTKSIWGDLERSIKDPQLTTLWRVSEALEMPLSQIIVELEQELGKNFSLIE